MKKRNSARRAATFLAALGALVMSSGVALMVSATPANADPEPKIVVCKYVSTPGDSELQGGGNPIEVSLNTLKNVVDDDWLDNPNRTFPKNWTDAQGQAGGGSIAIGYVDQGLTIADCPGGQEEPPPTCPQGTDHAGDPIPAGQTAEEFCNDEENPPATCPAGTDRAGDEIPEGQTAEEFCDVDVVVHTLCPEGTEHAGEQIPEGQTAEEFCDAQVSPPTVCDEGTDHAGQTIPEGETAEAFCNDSSTVVVSPPKVTHHTATEAAAAEATTTAVTPTVVHAGMGSLSQDMRGEQGLALMVAGMMMLTAAGGLGLRVRRAVSRI